MKLQKSWEKNGNTLTIEAEFLTYDEARNCEPWSVKFFFNGNDVSDLFACNEALDCALFDSVDWGQEWAEAMADRAEYLAEIKAGL